MALHGRRRAALTRAVFTRAVFTRAALAGAFLMAMAPGLAWALDARFKDANGDLVADTPTNPADLIDPPVMIFAYTPVEDHAVYAKVWDGFLKHTEKVTGKRVQFFPVQSNAAQIEAMRAGRLHVAGFNTGSTPLAVACSGFVPFAMMASLKDEYGYEMEVITFPGSGIQKIEDVRGKRRFKARSSRLPRKPRIPVTRRRPPCSATSSSWKPERTTRRYSPASTIIPCWAWRTRTTRRRRSPIP